MTEQQQQQNQTPTFNGLNFGQGAAILETNLAAHFGEQFDSVKVAVKAGGWDAIYQFIGQPENFIPFWTELTPEIEANADITYYSWAAQVKTAWLLTL